MGRSQHQRTSTQAAESASAPSGAQVAPGKKTPTQRRYNGIAGPIMQPPPIHGPVERKQLDFRCPEPDGGECWMNDQTRLWYWSEVRDHISRRCQAISTASLVVQIDEKLRKRPGMNVVATLMVDLLFALAAPGLQHAARALASTLQNRSAALMGAALGLEEHSVVDWAWEKTWSHTQATVTACAQEVSTLDEFFTHVRDMMSVAAADAASGIKDITDDELVMLSGALAPTLECNQESFFVQRIVELVERFRSEVDVIHRHKKDSSTANRGSELVRLRYGMFGPARNAICYVHWTNQDLTKIFGVRPLVGIHGTGDVDAKHVAGIYFVRWVSPEYDALAEQAQATRNHRAIEVDVSPTGYEEFEGRNDISDWLLRAEAMEHRTIMGG